MLASSEFWRCIGNDCHVDLARIFIGTGTVSYRVVKGGSKGWGFPKVPQSSQTESLGFPRLPPPPLGPEVGMEKNDQTLRTFGLQNQLTLPTSRNFGQRQGRIRKVKACELPPKKGSKHTLPETNSSPLKLMVGRRSFPFGMPFLELRTVSSRVTDQSFC